VPSQVGVVVSFGPKPFPRTGHESKIGKQEVFTITIKTDLRIVIKERVIHRHVRGIGRALIDERIPSITTFGPAPIA